MRRHTYSLLLLLCCSLLTLQACGGSAPSSTSFVTSSSEGLDFLAWHAGSDGTLSGQFEVLAMQGAPVEGQFTGKQDGSTLTFSFPSGSTTASVQGQLLHMQTIAPYGQTQNTAWYAISQEEYGKLAQVFVAYTGVRQDDAELQGLVQSPSWDSDPAYYDQKRTDAELRLAQERQDAQAIATAQGTMRCSLAADFSLTYPKGDATLQVPFSKSTDGSVQSIIDRSHLSLTLSTLQHDWKLAKALPLPHVAGLPLPWRVSPVADITSGRQHLSTLQTTVQRDAHSFTLLQQQDQSLHSQVSDDTLAC